MREELHPHPRHHGEQASHTVIHHPEEKETLLAGWLRRGLEMGPIFWVIIGGVLASAIAVVVGFNMWGMREAPNAKAWMELALARTADQQLKVAGDHPRTEAARWALLEAAGSVYDDGFKRLSISREVASPFLKRAYTLYSDVYNEAAKADPVVARLAALGMARALETTGDVPGAVKQYRLVASTWPGSTEAEQAERYAKRVENKEGEEFYKWLATFKPPEMTLPPKGQGMFDIPSLGLDAPLSAGSSAPLPQMPEDVFASPAPAQPKALTPEALPTTPAPVPPSTTPPA
ncbi:MAG TPA: hypothetical protein VGY53_06050, partial [Isosphaeraceae bacterium]|nr:hypothetical protein [Isosphaeraceae bacterium]